MEELFKILNEHIPRFINLNDKLLKLNYDDFKDKNIGRLSSFNITKCTNVFKEISKEYLYLQSINKNFKYDDCGCNNYDMYTTIILLLPFREKFNELKNKLIHNIRFTYNLIMIYNNNKIKLNEFQLCNNNQQNNKLPPDIIKILYIYLLLSLKEKDLIYEIPLKEIDIEQLNSEQSIFQRMKNNTLNSLKKVKSTISKFI